MKSTLNEQIINFSGSTSTEVVEQIKDWIVEEFGWVADGDILYVNSKQKIGFKFALSGTTLHVIPVNSLVAGTVGSTAAVQTSIVIRYHVSAGKSVVYIQFGNSSAIVAASDEDSNWYVFANNAGQVQTILCLSAWATAITTVYCPSIKGSEYSWSVTKFPSFAHGGSFSELFLLVSAKDYNYVNQLVDFDGKILRLVGLKGSSSASHYAFAFPVEDE